MSFLKTLALVSALLLPLSHGSLAQTTTTKSDTWFTASLFSYHSDRSANYNENNFGFGIEREVHQGTDRIIAGFYRNSIYRDSGYIGWSRTFYSYKGFNLNVVAGGVTGYRTSFPILPVFLPTLSWEYGRVGINLYGIPPIGGVSGVAAFQLKYKL